MRQNLTRRSLTIQDAEFWNKVVSKYQADIKKAKEEAEKLDHVEYQKKTKEQQKNIRKTLEKVDKMIAELNADVNIQINKIYLGLTNDRDDRIIPGQTMLEAGLSDQCIKLSKEGQILKASVFGYYVSALNRLEVLFSFFSKLQKVSKIYTENAAV